MQKSTVPDFWLQVKPPDQDVAHTNKLAMPVVGSPVVTNKLAVVSVTTHVNVPAVRAVAGAVAGVACPCGGCPCAPKAPTKPPKTRRA